MQRPRAYSHSTGPKGAPTEGMSSDAPLIKIRTRPLFPTKTCKAANVSSHRSRASKGPLAIVQEPGVRESPAPGRLTRGSAPLQAIALRHDDDKQAQMGRQIRTPELQTQTTRQDR